MKKFEAKTLEKAYELATNKFACSITQLDIQVIQQPCNGFLGFGKKNAIISVLSKKSVESDNKQREYKFNKKDIKIEDVSKKVEDLSKVESKEDISELQVVHSKEKIFDNFYHEELSKDEMGEIVVKKDKEFILREVKESLLCLFENTCYNIENIKVKFYDENTLYVEFNGSDSALLIGKEGYRYKALSYILFNWINEKYGLMLRLEVAEFLKNQEIAIHTYLEPIIELIKEKGRFKTKPLDGILVHIALKKLREEFPDKYVAVKTNVRGDKYVLVNKYRNNE